jgi:hypothetical protein
MITEQSLNLLEYLFELQLSRFVHLVTFAGKQAKISKIVTEIELYIANHKNAIFNIFVTNEEEYLEYGVTIAVEVEEDPKSFQIIVAEDCESFSIYELRIIDNKVVKIFKQLTK